MLLMLEEEEEGSSDVPGVPSSGRQVGHSEPCPAARGYLYLLQGKEGGKEGREVKREGKTLGGKRGGVRSKEGGRRRAGSYQMQFWGQNLTKNHFSFHIIFLFVVFFKKTSSLEIPVPPGPLVDLLNSPDLRLDTFNRGLALVSRGPRGPAG